jgi:hypothetical protein
MVLGLRVKMGSIDEKPALRENPQYGAFEAFPPHAEVPGLLSFYFFYFVTASFRTRRFRWGGGVRWGRF